MTSIPKKFKQGDRVIGNSRNVATEGRKGTVRHETGSLYWVLFDGDDRLFTTGLNPWWLDLLPPEESRPPARR